jgi:hypothetical protein
VRIVPARLTHVNRIALNMRAVDRIECEALGRSPKEALRFSLRTSLHAMTAVEDDETPVAMFGIYPLDAIGGSAIPWFLGTDRVFMHPRELLCSGRRILDWWRSKFPHLENIVAVENEAAIRLLTHWGAEVGGKTEVHRGVSFVPFRFPAIQALAKAA